MSKIWAMFCGIIFILGILYLMFYPVFFAIEHNATECIKGVPCYKMVCQWLQQEVSE